MSKNRDVRLMANVSCIFLTILKVNNFLQTRLIFEPLLLINQKKAFKTYPICQFYSFYLCFIRFLDKKNFRTKTILFMYIVYDI